MVVICLGCYQRPCACPQDVIATPAAPTCGAVEPTGAVGYDGGPARCERRAHRAGTMHEGNGLDWYDLQASEDQTFRPCPHILTTGDFRGVYRGRLDCAACAGLSSGLAVEATLAARELLPASPAARLELAPEEPDNDEARAYLDALRMALHVLVGGDEVSPAARAVLISDIRSVVGLFGRSPELGGAREGTS